MSLIKLGEATIIASSDLQSAESVMSDPEILERFKKVAKDLKSIAPKANDFLYFSAIMMHAAEASLLNEDGTIKKDASGNDVEASWEKTGDSWKWVCSDITIRPYKNSNGDIFPAEELLKAHRKWVGRPLCLDHKSASVDMIRGVIVDTYYDRPLKRIIALCALDKINYPDLARKVSTGYATSVSMGTAVGRAICYDCGTVARAEQDFCDHMRTKKCYGEINVDLNPIELSIVVNGADQKAKIRHIVAATNSLAQYVEMKEKEFSEPDAAPADDKHSGIVKSLDDAIQNLKDLKKEVKDLCKEDEGTKTPEMTVEASGTLKELEIKLDNLTEKVNKLSMAKTEDKNMTIKEGYFLGGGGVNEPTPGKPKYEKEDEDKIRGTEDKQMLQTGDMGSVDSMFPGDEQKKKELLRAASEQASKQLRRQAALEKAKENLVKKEAYFLGGGGVNEPTPGKPKYEKEDAEKIREKEDKQMVGASPFPGVGKIDGLYGDDLKKKEMLSRAKLTAKFIKAADSSGKESHSNSCWQVYADKKLILTATVKDITGGRVDALYDSVATEGFGKNLLAKIRTEGFDKVSGLFKAAEDAPPAVEAPAAPVGAATPDMGAAPAAEPVADKGDPKDHIPELLDTADNTLADIRKGVEALQNEPANQLSGFEDMGAAPMAPTASLVSMQKKLGKALSLGMRKVSKDLTSSISELKMAKHVAANFDKVAAEDVGYLNDLIAEACAEVRTHIADAHILMKSFVKYAEGTDELVKRAQWVQDVEGGQSIEAPPMSGSVSTSAPPAAPKPAVAPAKKVGPGAKSESGGYKPLGFSLDKGLNHQMPGRDPSAHAATGITTSQPAGYGKPKAPAGPAIDLSADHVPAGAEGGVPLMNADDDNYAATPEEIKLISDTAKAVKASADDLSTKEGRAMFRTKLAEKGLAFSDMLDKAHGKGGFTTQLDTKPTGDLAKVETLEETHKAMMDVALAPPRVRKAAEDIQKLVVAGRIDPTTQFPELIALGLDKDAVAYWKSLYGEAGKEGSQFAAELVKEHTAQKRAAEQEEYRVKLARAYEMSYDMAKRGMCGEDRSSITKQANEVMSYNDEAFASMQRWVDRQPLTKSASIPQVGMDVNVHIPAPEAAPSDIKTLFDSAFAGRKY